NQSISPLLQGSIRGFDINTQHSMIFENVLVIPEILYRLLSVMQIVRNGHHVLFTENREVLVFDKSGIIVLAGKEDCGQFIVSLSKIKNSSNNNPVIVLLSNSQLNAYREWHERLGHPGQTKLQRLKSLTCDEIEHLKIAEFYSCNSCNMGKLNRISKKIRYNNSGRDILEQ
ncbi:unnamed protein product, partial [Rotaria socialis]